MPWLQLKAHVAPEQADLLEELLLEEGATAIGLQDAHDDPVFEPERGTTPLWQDTIDRRLPAMPYRRGMECRQRVSPLLQQALLRDEASRLLAV